MIMHIPAHKWLSINSFIKNVSAENQIRIISENQHFIETIFRTLSEMDEGKRKVYYEKIIK